MKRVFSVLLSIYLLFSFAIAETNLSEMSYDELIALQKEVVKEIMSRPEWKEVEVPAGQYTIGVDIPAGWYSITPKNGYAIFRWYPNPDDDYWDYNAIDDRLGKFNFYEGMRIYLEDTVIFAPPLLLDF